MTNDFYNKVAEETNEYAALSQRKVGTVDNNWEDTNAEEIQTYIRILIYMGLVDLPEIEDYFEGDFCVRPIVRQTMTLKRLKKLMQYLHLNDEEERPAQQSADFDILYKARPALDLMDQFTQAHIPGCELAVDEAMIGFKGRFFLKQYLPGKPTKWGIKAWGVADSANGYLLKCDIYKGNSTRPSTRGTSCTAAYRQFLGKVASYLFRHFFQLHKCYWNKKRAAAALQRKIEKKK